jgi:hypothetical protein
MRAATRERMISIMALVLVISIGFPVPKAPAQSTARQTWAERFRVRSQQSTFNLTAKTGYADSLA